MGAAGADAEGVEPDMPAAGAGDAARGVPHSPQNRDAGALLVPHDGQTAASRAPHSPQNLRPGSLTVEQLGQVTGGVPSLARRVQDGDDAMASGGSHPCETPPMHHDADPAARLAQARVAYAGLVPRLAAGEPWPLAERFGTEPEADWGPREVLAHVAEMLPYWLGEYERVVEAGRPAGDGHAFGRVASNALRIGVLERDRTLPLRELVARIDAGIDRWERRVATREPGDDAAVGLHSTLGEMTAKALRDRFVTGHLEEHLEQLEAVLRG